MPLKSQSTSTYVARLTESLELAHLVGSERTDSPHPINGGNGRRETLADVSQGSASLERFS